MALASDPFGVLENSQFLRPTANGRMEFSLRLFEKLHLPSSRYVMNSSLWFRA